MTEVLDPGPLLDTAARDQLLRTLERALDSSDALVLTGSLPRGFSSDTYARIVRQASTNGMTCLVDASGETLRHVADACPRVIKPNRDEAAQLLGHSVQSIAQVAVLLRELHARGVMHPVITLGEQGALGLDGDVVWHAVLELKRSENAVGSGDCFLAGLAVATQRALPFDEALRLAVACGAANAMQEETGFVRRGDVESLRGQVQLKRITV